MKPEIVSENLAHSRTRMETPRVKTHSPNEEDMIATKNDYIGDESNPTVLPTPFLHGVTPVFLIRHPALVFESILRVSGPTMGAEITDDEFPVEASLRWLRVLYDLFADRAGSGMRPLLLNADEIIAHPTVVQRLCEQLQLDAAGVRFEWDAVPTSVIEGQSSYQQHFFSTIQSSSGVRSDKHSAAHGPKLDLDVVTGHWQDVYGESTAAALRSYVDAAMPDYEYLCRFELRE